jgi:hypothetical protein
MRLFAVALIAAVLVPSAIASAQTPPVVVVGPAPGTASGPPPQTAPTIPPGYEIEGELGGMHFRARVTTPAQPAPTAPVAPPPVVAPPPPPPPVVVAPPPAAPVMVVQQPTYAPVPSYAPPTLAYAPPPRRRYDARLQDDGMDWGARLALELVGAGIGFGLATGLAYLVDDNARSSEFTTTQLLTSMGLVPTGVAIFGGAIAGGRGRWGGAMLGTLIGGGLSATIVFAGGIDFHDAWEEIAAIAIPGVLGAIIGFEAQHGLRSARRERELEAQGGVQLSSVSVAPTAQGNGVLVGAAGTF